MPKIETEEVVPGFRKISIPPYQVDVLPIPNRTDRALTPMIGTNGQVQIMMPNRGLISIDSDGTAHLIDKDTKPILDFDSIKTGTLHADQVLTVGDKDGWRVEISGLTATYPIRYWNGTVTKFSLDKNGNVALSGSITASEIHIPSISAGANSFHVDVDGNVWWSSATLGGAAHKILKDGTATLKKVTLETNVVIKDLQAGSVIAGTYIDKLEANKIVAGSGIINALSVKSTLTMGDASNDGIIASYNWNDSDPGFYIKGGATPIFKIIEGVIIASSIQTQSSGLRTILDSNGLWFGKDSDKYVGIDVEYDAAGDGEGGININTLSSGLKLYTGLGVSPLGSFELGAGSVGISGAGKSNLGSMSMNFGDDSTGFGIEWSGNDTATRKLFSNLRMGSNWLPYNETYSLGSSDYKWKDLYLSGNITIAGTVDGTDISAHVSNANAHHSSTSNGLTITPTKVNINSPAGTTAALNVNGEFHLYTGSINIKNQSASLAWANEVCLSVPSTGGISRLMSSKNFTPVSDNSLTCGASGYRWSEVWAVNGTIQTSTRKEKSKIKKIGYGLESLRRLQPISFQWKKKPRKDSKSNKIGLIAEDVQKVIPEVIYGNNQGINYGELVPVLIKAIKELDDRLKKIEKN